MKVHSVFLLFPYLSLLLAQTKYQNAVYKSREDFNDFSNNTKLMNKTSEISISQLSNKGNLFTTKIPEETDHDYINNDANFHHRQRRSQNMIYSPSTASGTGPYFQNFNYGGEQLNNPFSMALTGGEMTNTLEPPLLSARPQYYYEDGYNNYAYSTEVPEETTTASNDDEEETNTEEVTTTTLAPFTLADVKVPAPFLRIEYMICFTFFGIMYGLGFFVLFQSLCVPAAKIAVYIVYILLLKGGVVDPVTLEQALEQLPPI